jgi:Domain of unknown function (DUF4159)
MNFILLAALLTTVGPWPTEAVGDSITVGRLQYDGGGDWYANPSSLPNLLAGIRERTGIPVAHRAVNVKPLASALRDFPYIYMTGHGNVHFNAAEREALRSYLLAGGFLHADDNYGLDDSFRKEIAGIFPDAELTPLPPSHPVFHIFYDFPDGLPKIHEHDGKPPQALGIIYEGRLVVLYSYESDLGDGWEDPDVHDDPPDIREQALRMGVNIFLFVLGQAVS